MSDTLPPHRRLSWFKRIGLVGLPTLLVFGVWGGVSLYFSDLRNAMTPERPVAEIVPADGAKLFQQNCAYCQDRKSVV